jgi:hypothetical protein
MTARAYAFAASAERNPTKSSRRVVPGEPFVAKALASRLPSRMGESDRRRDARFRAKGAFCASVAEDT